MAKTKGRPGKKINARKAKKESRGPRRFAPIKLPIRKILYAAAIILLLAAFFIFLRNSPYFRLNDIKIIDRQNIAALDGARLLNLYKGRNIFDIDIDSIASRIKSEHPIIERALVKRVLPDRLRIDIISRVPFAVIKSHGYFPVDRTGMVLSPEVRRGKLLVITGLSSWFAPRVGERLKGREIENAFLLIDALRGRRFSPGYEAATIDVANHRNLSFYFGNGIEVKIGGENFEERLKMLKKTLSRRDLDKASIKYVDLRFKDVVIGPK
jgi:cell division septal protein FtsQ